MSECKPWVQRIPVIPGARAAAGGAGRRPAALLLLLTLVTHGFLTVVEAADPPQRDDRDDKGDDEESDNAPFAVVVQHDSDGEDDAAWYCGGSLVSLRAVLTSRWCARGRELAVLAAGALPARMDGVRRIARVVYANELGGILPGEMDDSSEVIKDGAWSGASLDIALLELEAPFGVSAGVRPILMATTASDCGFPNACHAVSVRSLDGRPLLRIVDLAMARGEVCSDIARHWAAVRDHVLCLSGKQLCPSDRGTGVVCGGKLCGVVSRSARAAMQGGGAGCGDTTAAQSVPRWRRFLQCAHTAHACDRDGECAELCMERQLLPEAEPIAKETSMRRTRPPLAADDRPRPTQEPSTVEPAEETPPATTTHVRVYEVTFTNFDTESPTTTSTTTTHTCITEALSDTRRKDKRPRGRKPADVSLPTRSVPPPTAPAPAPAPLTVAGPPAQPPRMEYDPSRADFKAGEYGDNAAEYAGMGEEPAASSSSGRSPAPPSTTTPTRSLSPQHTPESPPAPAEQHAAPGPAATGFALLTDQPPRLVPAKLAAADSADRPQIFYLFYFVVYFYFFL